MFFRLCALCAALGMPALLAGCALRTGTALVREDLFTLDIGRLEGEINLYDDLKTRSEQKSSIVLSDGLFYISNTSGQKITRYNSYGDVLFMIYNEETNPPLLDLKVQTDLTPSITRWAVPYPLQNPGAIALDDAKHIFAADCLSEDRRVYDGETGMLYDSILLHFDANGRFIEYLGRQGRGGSLFPHIERIFISEGGDIAIISKTGTQHIVYWFSKNGVLQYEFSFTQDNIPLPETDAEILPALDCIAAAPDKKLLYIKVDYYREEYDATTRTLSGTSPYGCSLWVFSVEENRYIGEIEAPFYESVSQVNGRRVTEELFYSMLGILPDGEAVLYFPLENGYEILALRDNSKTRVRKHGFISADSSELEYSSLSLSSNGIISALLASEWEVKVVWWRTDRLK